MRQLLITNHCSLGLAEERGQGGEEGSGDDLGAFGGGVDAVVLDGVGDVDEVFVDHGDEGGVMLCREVAEDLVELVDVVGAVVGGQGDAGEQDLDVGGFKGGEDLVEIAACLIEREAAEAVVAAEFDEDDFRVEGQDGVEAGDGVFGSGAAGALIDDFVVEAAGVEVALEGVGVGLVGVEAVAGGDAVAEADEQVLAEGLRGQGEEEQQECGFPPISQRARNGWGTRHVCRYQQAKGNDKSAANVHMGSVSIGCGQALEWRKTEAQVIRPRELQGAQSAPLLMNGSERGVFRSAPTGRVIIFGIFPRVSLRFTLGYFRAPLRGVF